jgi:hypothetical protein
LNELSALAAILQTFPDVTSTPVEDEYWNPKSEFEGEKVSSAKLFVYQEDNN